MKDEDGLELGVAIGLWPCGRGIEPLPAHWLLEGNSLFPRNNVAHHPSHLSGNRDETSVKLHTACTHRLYWLCGWEEQRKHVTYNTEITSVWDGLVNEKW
jgi:hypothetical protein